ncbi:MAG: TonB-dependent siderophore receptor, partial [Gammaproteobacteria bacterium]|nr:TonB-dependent siderophore receptor [Gammaproteobacteria bacterium]
MMATSPLSYAASEQVESEEIQLDALKIEDRTSDTNPYAEDGAPYKARISGDERRVKPLAETPQTIKVLTQTQIKDSGKSDLKEIISAQPGITLGTGENGNAFGDRYIIRGHEARSDVFVDGLRDPGMTTRESFAVEQVEITKGPSATFAGRGSTGGAVNSITKQASRDYDFSSIEAGVGTDDYRRVTVDSNKT